MLTHSPPGDALVILQIFKFISRRAVVSNSCEIALGWIPHWWLVKIGSGNGLVPAGNKPLPVPTLTKFFVTLGYYEAIHSFKIAKPSIAVVLTMTITNFETGRTGLLVTINLNFRRKLHAMCLSNQSKYQQSPGHSLPVIFLETCQNNRQNLPNWLDPSWLFLRAAWHCMLLHLWVLFSQKQNFL